MKISGRVWKYGDNVNTDYIIPGRYMELTDHEEMGRHAMEGIDLAFVLNVKKGDVVVGGRNFGCGSSREHAPLALKYAGVGCVVAESCARIFYRNAVNIGLPALECPRITKSVELGDDLELDLGAGTVTNMSKGTKLLFTPLPPFMMDVLEAGGLVPYLNKRNVW
ncbi:MAG: 3-isopropylmalate dehydratase small subunit [Candidatus Bathyarchaeia archaeon]